MTGSGRPAAFVPYWGNRGIPFRQLLWRAGDDGSPVSPPGTGLRHERRPA